MPCSAFHAHKRLGVASFTCALYDQFLQSSSFNLSLCPFLQMVVLAHDLCLRIINKEPTGNPGKNTSCKTEWTESSHRVRGRHKISGLPVMSHQPLMRGPAARTKYNLRKSSIFYVEKVSTYPHQNPGLAEQHSSVTECPGTPKVCTHLSLLPSKAVGPSVPTPKVKHADCTGS